MDALTQLNTALAGRYLIEREIGAGGMATVHLARDVRHDRKVALKVLRPELGAVLGVERFLAEIKVTANLQHPNLLPLFDSGEANGLLFYVMPYVEGESLRARLDREKQLPIDEAVRIAVAIASALDYAHGHGVIHRDLKPENILMQSGQPVVADFGIALAVSNAGGTRVTQTGLSLGTPQYMSPEQATGDRVIDGRADIYSLAAMTFEMLTGEPPHTGNTMQAIIARILTEQPRSVRAIRSHVPEHVELALERGLEKLPADRWPTAREFADALQGRSVSTTQRTSARSPMGHVVARRGVRARLTDPLVLVLAATTLGAALFGARMWSAAHRPLDAGPTIRFPLTLPRDVLFTATLEPSIAISRDAGLIAFVGRGVDGVQRLFVRTAQDPTARPVTGTEGATSVFISPNAKWLGFMATGKMRKASVEGGGAVTVADVGNVFNGASWTDGGQIVYSTFRGRLFVISENGGTPRPLCPTATEGAVAEMQPLVLPDGETVLYSRWASSSMTTGKLAIASLARSQCTVLDADAVQPAGIIDGRVLYVTSAGTLMAAAIDLPGRRLTSVPEAILTDVGVHPSSGVAQLALSPTGTLVHQGGAASMQVVLADARGVTQPVIEETRTYGYPRFSPDGRKIAITYISPAQRDIWIYDIAARTSTRLTSQAAVNERAEWTPDGKRVLYRSNRGERADLWWRAADLSEPEQPLFSRDREDVYEGVITPDGLALVYQLDTVGPDIMYRLLKGDTTPRPFAATPFLETQARVSPNGKWVAFVSSESGGDQIVVQPFPGPGPRTQVSTGGGSEPVWARDGRRLYYRDNQSFIAATVSGDSTFTVTTRQVLFPDSFVRGIFHANYDVSSDGRLLLLKSVGAAEVMVVYNWADELRKRLSGRVER